MRRPWVDASSPAAQPASSPDAPFVSLSCWWLGRAPFLKKNTLFRLTSNLQKPQPDKTSRFVSSNLLFPFWHRSSFVSFRPSPPVSPYLHLLRSIGHSLCLKNKYKQMKRQEKNKAITKTTKRQESTQSKAASRPDGLLGRGSCCQAADF